MGSKGAHKIQNQNLDSNFQRLMSAHKRDENLAVLFIKKLQTFLNELYVV